MRKLFGPRLGWPDRDASALLLAGVPVHVVSRRLGHRDVQTTLNRYAHVTDDAELQALADWRRVTAGSGTTPDERSDGEV